MWKKVLVTGTVAAAILGAGGVALAATSPSPTPSATAGAKADKGKAGHHRRDDLANAVHGQVTVKTKDGFVTHDGIRGTVTAVSPTSITVKAADGTSETYVVDGTTVVHTKADGKSKGTTGAIGKVQDGDTVGVLGTGTTTLTATHVVDRTR